MKLRAPHNQWEATRPGVQRALGLPSSPEEYLRELGERLDGAFRHTAQNLPQNVALRVESTSRGTDALDVSNLDEIEEPESLAALRKKLGGMLPRADLPELMVELHEMTGFTEAFTHVTEGGHRVKDLHKSVCAVLLAEACNVGLEPLVDPKAPALTRSRLSWVAPNYLRADTITEANDCLADAQAGIPLTELWALELRLDGGLRRSAHSPGPTPMSAGIAGIGFLIITCDGPASPAFLARLDRARA